MRIRNYIPIYIVAFVLSGLVKPCLAYSQEGQFNLASSKGKLEALVIGQPRLLKIKVKGVGPRGQIQYQRDQLRGQLSVEMKTLKTGIGLRDRHLKNKYIHIKKYPKATLLINELQLTQTQINAGLKDQKFQGLLKFHGVQKIITGFFELKPKSQTQFQILAEFDINLTDFSVNVPSYLGVTVAEKVKIRVSSLATFSPKENNNGENK